MINQPFLKPGVLRPLPVALRKSLAAVQAAVCFALQKYFLPIAELIVMTVISCNEIFHALRNAGKGVSRQEAGQR